MTSPALLLFTFSGAIATALFLGLPNAASPQGKDNKKQAEPVLTLDFQKAELPPGWSISNKTWKVEGGELRGEGGGTLDLATPVSGDFTITFDAWFEEKGSIELKILDADAKKEYYTFAFGGMYHPVLDGVKSSILKENGFVNVDSKMWIFPGRMFHFEVRSAKSQYQMFLNSVLGPVFADPAPPAAEQYRIRFVTGTESKKDKIRMDNIKIELRK